ncbi:Oidioi.mRNA.OKI2018_I69.XSR.g14751.t1.cds [Oikopleura dioica]|uniref:Oidioi.mRNA.OKI2018_I69.XSR.g14751.t1.cds n=1 Tax=Oikopleura dioica TaxID=34765 RepID=A0ABN7SJQ2_OIKDI|nr:Oidioi.mRNA.OKI2018_I69.XSR.g14751.t1.cds [Oikopleura dioica]
MENLPFFCCSTPRESSPEHDSGIHLTPESGYYEEKTSYTHNISDFYERYLQNTNLDGSFESGSQSQKSEDLFSREDMQSQTFSETSMQTIEEEVYYKNLAEEFMGPPVETSLSQESQTNFTQEINEAVDDGQLYPNSQHYYREMAEEFEREEEMIHPDSQRPESQQWSSQLSESYAIFEKTDSDQ